MRIPRARYCFSINGQDEEMRLLFLLYNFGVQIIPFESEKLEKNHRKEKKDTTENMREAGILKATNRGTFCVDVV